MFNLETVKIENEFEPIPAGFYPAYVDQLEMKESKAGARYINIRWKIFGEEYANRVIFDMLHIYNANEKARNIAMQSLKKIFLASGFEESSLNFTSEEDMLARLGEARVMIKVAIRKSEEYGDKNEVKNYIELKEDVAEIPTNLPF